MNKYQKALEALISESDYFSLKDRREAEELLQELVDKETPMKLSEYAKTT